MTLAMMLSGAASGPPAPVQFYKDLFAGSAGDPISAHTANIGGGYTLAGGTGDNLLDGAGGLRDTGIQTEFHNNSTPPSADYTVTFDLHCYTDAGGFGVSGRAVDISNKVVLQCNPGAPNFRLFQAVSGTTTILDSLPLLMVAGQTWPIILAFSGTQVQMTVNGNTNGPVTTAVLLAGKVGTLTNGFDGGVSTGYHLQNIQATG